MIKILAFFTSPELVKFAKNLVEKMFDADKTPEEKKAYVFDEIKKKFIISSSDANWAIETILKYLKARFQGDRDAK